MAKSLPEHFKQIKDGVDSGREELKRLREEGIPIQHVKSTKDKVFLDEFFPAENDK